MSADNTPGEIPTERTLGEGWTGRRRGTEAAMDDCTPSEALSSWALFLSMIAIVGFALSVAAFGFENILLSVTAGLLSLTSFVASMFMFSTEAEELVDA